MSKMVGHISTMLSHVATNSPAGRAIAFSFVGLLAACAGVSLAIVIGLLGASSIHAGTLFLISSGLLFLVFIERVFL